MRRTAAATLVALAPALARGDEVYLRGGGRISGEIVARTPAAVTIDIGGGEMSIEMAYVLKIESGASDLQRFRERAGELAPGDVEEWRELARWAEARGLHGQARGAWENVVASRPDDPEANRALGRRLLDGAWVSEEEYYLAHGWVEFDGRWMSPEERAALVAERDDLLRRDREALTARLRAEEEAAWAAQFAAPAESTEVGWGDLYPPAWGWGYAPPYWPRDAGHGRPIAGPSREPRPQAPRPAPLPAPARATSGRLAPPPPVRPPW